MVKHAPSPWLLTSPPLYAILPKNARWKQRAAFLPATFVARDAASRETSRTTCEGTAAGNAQGVRGECVILCLNHWWWNTNSCPHVSPILKFLYCKADCSVSTHFHWECIQQKNVCKKLESLSTNCATCLPKKMGIPCQIIARNTFCWKETRLQPQFQVRLSLTISPDMEIPIAIYSKTTRDSAVQRKTLRWEDELQWKCEEKNLARHSPKTGGNHLENEIRRGEQLQMCFRIAVL